MNFLNMAMMGGRGLQSMAPGMRGGGLKPPTLPAGTMGNALAGGMANAMGSAAGAGMAQPLGPQKPGMRDMMGAVGGMLTGAGGQGQAQMGALPTAPAIPIQVSPLNPLYDFERFRFNFGNQPGLLG